MVGKLVKTVNGAIWTIAKDEVIKITWDEGRGFISDDPFWTDSGFVFGLGLAKEEGGEDGVVALVNASDVTVKFEAIVTIQQEKEVDVKGYKILIVLVSRCQTCFRTRGAPWWWR